MNTQSLVSWTYALADANGYSLERSMNSGGVWAEVLSCSAAITSYYDNDLTWHDYPWYRVSALNPYGQGPASLFAKVRINSPGIDRPQLTGSQGPFHATQSLLNWAYSGSVQGAVDEFTLERSVDSGSNWIAAWFIDPTGSAFVDDPQAYGSSYWYRIKAHCDFGLYGPYSNIVAVFLAPWPPVPMPDLITAVQSPVYAVTSSVNWSFTGSAAEAEGYVLERAWRNSPERSFTYANFVTFSGLGTTTFQDTAVTWSREYAYKMYAYSGSAPEIRRSTETPATVSFMQALPPQLQVWQQDTSPMAVAFWGNYLGQYTMSLSRSSDDGATWDITTFISPTSGGYFYEDRAVSVGNTYTYKVRETYWPNQPESITASVTILPPETSRTSLAYMADAGFQYDEVSDTVWEHHTASLLEANYSARHDFKVSHWLLGGDNVYVSNNFRGGYDGQVGRLSGPSSSCYAVLGNHDISDGGVINYRNFFNPWTTSFTWPGGSVSTYRFYTQSFAHTDVWFLETTSDTSNLLDPSQRQWFWFSESIAHSRTKPDVQWRLAIVHVPGITSMGSGHVGNPYLRALPWHEWGVDMMFAGHVHWLERMESASVCFVNNSLMGSDKRTPSPTSSYTKWFYAGGEDDDDYVWTLLEMTQNALTMSQYSGSVLVPDTGSTELLNAVMDNGRFILMKPWFGPPTMSSVTQVGELQELAVSWSFTGDYSQSLFRSADSGATWPVTTSIDPGVFNYLDATVVFEQTYWYKVRQTRFPTEPYSDVMSQYVWPPVPSPNLLYTSQP